MVLRDANKIALGALLYCLAYLVSWLNSVDQWYVPAGLRLASVLMLPRRLWIAPFLGEVAAISLLQIPYMWERGLAWTVLSPFRNFPVVAGAAIAMGIGNKKKRKHGPALEDVISLGLVACVASTLTNIVCASLLMDGYCQSLNIGKTLVYSFGDYLGIMLVVPCAFVMRKPREFLGSKLFVRDFSISIGALCALGFVYLQTFERDIGSARLCCLAAFIPAFALTARHGWKGAAAGVVIANVFDAAGMNAPSMLGARDDAVLLAQASIALLGTCLISFGGLISRYHAAACLGRVEHQDAIRVAQRGYTYSEDRLRRLRSDFAHALRQSRTPVLAAANGERIGMDTPFELSPELDAVYSLNLDRFGLFAALDAPSIIGDMARRGITYQSYLSGPAHRLPEAYQRAAYRIAMDAIAFFREQSPTAIHLSVKVSRSGRLRALVVVSSEGGQEGAGGYQYLIDAKDRCKAFGAVVRERPKRFIAVLQP